MDLERAYGLTTDGQNLDYDPEEMHRYISLKLASLGINFGIDEGDDHFLDIADGLLATYRERGRLLADHLCPMDQRIQDFLDDSLRGLDVGSIRLPSDTFVLDRHGLARELSLPQGGNCFKNDIVASNRLRNGICNNPKNDRRTTKGSFHVAQGGLPVPADKKEVPLLTYGRLLHHALNSCPADLMRLPYTSERPQVAGELFVSLHLRPLVCPTVPGFQEEKRSEIRFFAPGSLVSNLDFVESIFGNAGDPALPENDAGLDIHHWSGHTGCIILAPQLTRLKKKDLGLPHISEATERQKRDGMYYESEDELYNDGTPFKITHRDERGTMVTLIADNYYGYCKKEVKTQLSYAANLFGLAEEEHAGGALAFVRISYGEEFHVDSQVSANDNTLDDVRALLGDRVVMQDDGYGIDANYGEVLYMPADMNISLADQQVSWTVDGEARSIKLLPGKYYVHPSGYKVHLEKHPGAPSWRLVGTKALGTFCHKPCTVSGGGKSEISKSMVDAVLYGPIYTEHLDRDFAIVREIFKRDYSDRMKGKYKPDYTQKPSRPVLDPDRSLGSVIKMFTPSPEEFTPEYNAWLASIPKHVWPLVFIIKRFYKQEWGEDWDQHFHVDIVNGQPGHELKYGDRTLVGSYMRVGVRQDGSWRTFKLRQDFIAAHKVQMEDDISASIVVPPQVLGFEGEHSLKLVQNCEHRLFQRPDDAIHRGLDKQTELEMSQPGLFCSNFEPLTKKQVKAEVEDIIHFDAYTPPMKKHLKRGTKGKEFTISSALPRLVDGVPTKNPRYLQVRPDLSNGLGTYIAEIGVRLSRGLDNDEAVVHPVDAVLPGRRNNPPEPGIPPLAVFNPIHYQELPELFMDFVASLTGKSPSTTGAGSEGALTKGPFNALRTTADLNNALVSYILCGHHGFSSAAGYIGPEHRVEHDISMLIPELWSRLTAEERDPAFLIAEGHLEQLQDFDHEGRPILASRLGYRITEKFVHTYFGKIFDNPAEVFDQSLLRPESQDMQAFIDGIDNIVNAQQRVAQAYLDDGSIEDACPPLAALLHIMATGSFEGKDASHPDIRAMFTREYLLASEWYQDRLTIRQERAVALWQRHVSYLETFLDRDSHSGVADRLQLPASLREARTVLNKYQSPAYRDSLLGTLGADPISVHLRAPATV